MVCDGCGRRHCSDQEDSERPSKESHHVFHFSFCRHNLVSLRRVNVNSIFA